MPAGDRVSGTGERNVCVSAHACSYVCVCVFVRVADIIDAIVLLMCCYALLVCCVSQTKQNRQHTCTCAHAGMNDINVQ